MDDNLNEEEKEKLRLENEIRKIKLELEKGAKFIEDPDMPGLPPEIENEFLNYIEQFEDMREDGPKMTIFEKIGSPLFKNPEMLDEDELNEALELFFQLLNEHDIYVDSLYEIDDREMYRFITEDIFPQEVFTHNLLDGMMMHFNYEDYYPDVIKDVIAQINDFMEHLLDVADTEQLFQYEVNDLSTSNKWLYDFRDSYHNIDLHDMNVNAVTVHEEEVLTAEVVFDVSFDAYTNGLTEKHSFNGTAYATLIDVSGDWLIQTLSLPKAK
ncbi:MAG: hypothetical protein IPG85_15690 [Bacteroidetes bacterium]|nr:hypothetical protein [Bacteroidota bacterium]